MMKIDFGPLVWLATVGLAALVLAAAAAVVFVGWLVVRGLLAWQA